MFFAKVVKGNSVNPKCPGHNAMYEVEVARI